MSENDTSDADTSPQATYAIGAAEAPVDGSCVKRDPAFDDARVAIAPDRVDKGRLLMAGLEQEIGGLWDTMNHMQGAPAPSGFLDLTDHSIQDLLNWLRRALTTIRSLDHEIFEKSDPATYQAARQVDPRGMTIRGLTAPRNNAVHHPEVVDPQVDRALGPLDGHYVIFPAWVERTNRLDPMFTTQKGFSQSYADAYDEYVAGRTLHDTLLDAFGFFDTLAPDLARRDEAGQLTCFPLPPPPFAEPGLYFRLSPSSPNEHRQQALLDAQLRLQLEMNAPTGLERVITGAFEAEPGHVVLVGYTILHERFTHQFFEPSDQVTFDIRRGYRYVLDAGVSPGSNSQVLEVAADLTLAGGRPLPTAELLRAGSDGGERARVQWELCRKDPRHYARFRRPRA
ncbi:hypothetical protein [Intrasporangium flavum]|uniref:hypothetical protein n=1 Tax=Intrasporangium flavum TaxID=1428657 RepID=UPI001A97AD4E|nr:hypothetical protein [Intrasporangium flavum]